MQFKSVVVSHIDENNEINQDKLSKTSNSNEMLMYVIDYNYYSVDKAKNSI